MLICPHRFHQEVSISFKLLWLFGGTSVKKYPVIKKKTEKKYKHSQRSSNPNLTVAILSFNYE